MWKYIYIDFCCCCCCCCCCYCCFCSFCFFCGTLFVRFSFSFPTLNQSRGYSVQPRLRNRSRIIKQRTDHDFSIKHQIRHNIRWNKFSYLPLVTVRFSLGRKFMKTFAYMYSAIRSWFSIARRYVVVVIVTFCHLIGQFQKPVTRNHDKLTI